MLGAHTREVAYTFYRFSILGPWGINSTHACLDFPRDPGIPRFKRERIRSNAPGGEASDAVGALIVALDLMIKRTKDGSSPGRRSH